MKTQDIGNGQKIENAGEELNTWHSELLSKAERKCKALTTSKLYFRSYAKI